MTEKTWHSGLLSVKGSELQCIVACCFGCLGACIIQACNAKRMNGKMLKPLCCAGCLLCVGMALNRKAVRKEYQIKGSCLVETLQYAFGCCFLVAQEYREIAFQKSNWRKLPLPPPPLQPLPPSPVLPNAEDIEVPLIKKSSETNPPSRNSKVLEGSSSSEVSNRQEKGKNHCTNADSDSALDPPLPVIKGPIIIPPPEEPIGDIGELEIESNRSVEQLPPESQFEEPSELAVSPLDGIDPNVYSHIRSTPPFSFLIGMNRDDACQPPTYLPLSTLALPKPNMSQDILGGLVTDEEGGLVCVDKEALRKQEGVASHVLKQLGWAILKGLGAVSISLPIRIFEARSTCERLIDRFSFAPVFLRKAAQLTDQWERFKLVLAFAVASMYLGVKQEKPFNPLLGETMQGSFPDGAKIYCEHTMHNPPTDHFYITGPGYSVYGYYQLDGSFTGNSLVGSFLGPTTVYFRDGQTITYRQPKFKLGGIITGKRTLNWIGDISFEDVANNWLSVIKLQPTDKEFNPRGQKLKRDQFLGKIYHPKAGKKDKIEKVLAELSGSWMESFKIETPANGSQVYWTIDEDLPLRHCVEERPLPSDWRYREDLIWLFRGNQEIAQNWKSKLEQKQRSDREKRLEASKRRKR